MDQRQPLVSSTPTASVVEERLRAALIEVELLRRLLPVAALADDYRQHLASGCDVAPTHVAGHGR
jgi:hypothetical protein